MDMLAQREKAIEMIRAVYLDSVAEINGRKYKFQSMSHTERRKVFGFYTSIQRNISNQDFSFLDTPQYANVEEVMWSNITFNGVAINKLRNHWEEYPEDYINLLSVAMGVMSYPFIRAAATVSASQDAEPAKTLSEKPM